MDRKNVNRHDVDSSVKRGIYDNCYKGSSQVDITAYFEDYKRLINESIFKEHYYKNLAKDKSEIMKMIGDDINEERLELLSEYCKVDHLTVNGELKKMNRTTFEWFKDPEDLSILENCTLKTVANAKKRHLLRNHQTQLKYRSEKIICYDPAPPGLVQATPESDILVYVRVYVPFTSRHKQSTGALGKLSVNHVIAVHGSQTLDKLRDQISCISDYSISTEMSKTPMKIRTPNARDVYKSGFFFIEDTFYNDFRDPRNNDNSKVVRDWAESRNLGVYKTAKMEETRIDSLVCRFGFPWVYQHQGDCEHLISFSDARLVNPSDELNISCYPMIVRIKPRPNRYCMTCGLYNVNWVTTSNSRLPHNPCLFCDSCFKSYNYIQGKRIGTFKAYPYPYDADLLEESPSNTISIIKQQDMEFEEEEEEEEESMVVDDNSS